MEANELIKRIAGYGADMEGVSDRFGDDAELYESCFVSLLEDPEIAALETAMENKNYEAAFDAAHPIKGLAGNLALTPFYDAVCALVESLRAKRYESIDEEYARVKREYIKLLILYHDETQPVLLDQDVAELPDKEDVRKNPFQAKKLQSVRKKSEQKSKAGFNALFVMTALLLLFSTFMFFRSTARIEASVLAERTEYVTEISKQIINNQQSLTKLYRQMAKDYGGIVSREDITSLEELRTCLSDDTVMRMLIMSDRGRIIDSYGTPVFLPDRRLYQELSDSGNHVAQAFTSLNNAEDYWLFTMPVKTVNIEGTDYSTFILAVPASEYEDGLAVSLLEGNGASFLADENGMIIIKPKTGNRIFSGYNLFAGMENIGINDADIQAFMNEYGSIKEYSMIVRSGNTELLVSSSGIDEQKNSIVVVVPLSITAADTYAGLSNSIVFVSLMVLSIALVVILLILYVNRRDTLRKKAALAVEAKDEFLSKMSHDLRTPLNAIIGLETLAKASNDLAAVKGYLDESHSASRYMLGLINDMLDMNRIESGKMAVERAPFEIRDVIGEIKTIVSSMAKDKELTFCVSGEEEFSSAYLGDAGHIKQIVMNLLSNAVKFTKPGGTVSLQVYRDRSEGNLDSVVFVISDTGVGMSKAFQNQMFAPFTQERSSYTKQLEGSGLGLSIVQSLVTLMNGSIRVESEEGAGSAFTVLLPLERTDMPAHKKNTQVEEILSYAGNRVLIVDDNRTNQLIMSEILKLHFHIVTEAAIDGKQSVAAFVASARGYYDLIFMDINMPVMGGLEAAQRIRELPRADAKTIPIIALSANAYDRDVALSLSAGMNAHLVKPVTVEALNAIFIEYLHVKEEK